MAARVLTRAAAAFGLVAIAGAASAAEADADRIARGRYLFQAADCRGCHTDVAGKGPLLAGGRAIATPFGTFYGPNITPDPEHGIGSWTDAQFVRALREGIAPDGSFYFPAFPYPSFTGMTESDLLDLKAYIFSLEPVATPSRPHSINVPFGWRFLQTFWRWLYFAPGPFVPDPEASAEVDRGAYLANAVAHCGECHTPRNALGALRQDQAMAGSEKGPDGKPVPNITPHPEAGIGQWSSAEIVQLLKDGMRPDNEFVGGPMGEAIEAGTRHLRDADLAAIAAYLKSLPPSARRPGKPAP